MAIADTGWTSINAGGMWAGPIRMPRGDFDVSLYGDFVGTLRLQKHQGVGPLKALSEDGWHDVDLFSAPAMGLPCTEAMEDGGWWRFGAGTGDWVSGTGFVRLRR